MQLLKSFLFIVLFALCMPLAGQTPTFEELEFEPDSVKTTYKPAGKNYVLIRSKRGSGGLNKTPNGDAIVSSEVTEIVLVFSETEASALADRETENRERWENLLMTYPEFFQFSTTYKNVCQCNLNGDAEAFKKSQGFYVYVNGPVPKPEEPVASTPPPVKTEEPPAVAKPTKAVEPPAPVKPLKSAEKEIAVADNTAVKVKEPVPVKEAPAKEVPKAPEPVATQTQEEAPETPVAETRVKKKPAIVKARRAKDNKACRPACYGYGDEDLYLFFKDNIPLTKKQKRKAKNWIAQVRLQIHFDGTIKKAIVTGANEEFNKKVEDIVKSMNPWNCAVKSGLAVKSEVRFTLKFDKESKSMKPFDIVANPKPSAKCPCVSDSEMFGSD